jgi:DNA-binding transcriptional LysR family regulator
MELRELAAFRAVATTGSVTKAASLLNYVQSSVTAQVQSLEADLERQLFDRVGRRLVLNDAGKRLLPYAEHILGLVTEARGALSADATEVRGTVSIGAPESLCTYRLPKVLQACRTRFPAIQLVFRPLAADELRREVSTGALDVAFLLDEPTRARGLCVETLIDEPIIVLAAPDHPLAGRSAVTPLDLKGESILLTEAGCTYRGLFLRILGNAGVYPPTVLEFGSVEAIKQCIIAGMGLTVLPEVAVKAELASGRLARLRWTGPEMSMATQLIWHPDRQAATALAAFLALVREGIG